MPQRQTTTSNGSATTTTTIETSTTSLNGNNHDNLHILDHRRFLWKRGVLCYRKFLKLPLILFSMWWIVACFRRISETIAFAVSDDCHGFDFFIAFVACLTLGHCLLVGRPWQSQSWMNEESSWLVVWVVFSLDSWFINVDFRIVSTLSTI